MPWLGLGLGLGLDLTLTLTLTLTLPLTLLTRQAHALAAALLSPEELDSVQGCQELALVQARLAPNPSPTQPSLSPSSRPSPSPSLNPSPSFRPSPSPNPNLVQARRLVREAGAATRPPPAGLSLLL